MVELEGLLEALLWSITDLWRDSADSNMSKMWTMIYLSNHQTMTNNGQQVVSCIVVIFYLGQADPVVSIQVDGF